MDFKQLRSFVAVADCGSFTQAAAQLYTSQPTVSAHIRQLEEELQQRLFLRTTKSLSITPHGRELYDYAVQVLSLQDRLLAGWRQGEHVVSLGVSTIPSAYLLPDLLARFSVLHPDISFDIHQSDSSGVLRALRTGRFDLGLTGMTAPDEDLVFTPFYQDAMCSSHRTRRNFPPPRRRICRLPRSCSHTRSCSGRMAAAASVPPMIFSALPD